MTTNKDSFMYRWLIWPKLCFFSVTFVLYMTKGFQTDIYLKTFKLSLVEYSFILVLDAVNMIGALVWGYFADRTGKHKTILMATTLVYVLSKMLLLLQNYFPEGSVFKLLYVSAVTFVSNFFMAAIFPLMDTLMVTFLAEDPKLKDKFNNQRMFAAIGHSASYVLAGFLLNISKKYTKDGKKWDPIVFIASLFAGALFLLVSFFGLPDKATKKDDHHKGDSKKKEGEGETLHQPLTETIPNAPTPAPPQIEIDLTAPKNKTWLDSPAMKMMKNIHFVMFMVFILGAGLIRQVLSSFQNFFICEVFGVSEGSSQLPSICRMFSEIVIMFFGKAIQEKIGVYWALILSQVFGILRLAGYSFIPGGPKYQWTPYVFESMKGINSGLLNSAAVKAVTMMAPKECVTTALSLYSGNFAGLSSALSGFYFALLFKIGPQPTTVNGVIKYAEPVKFVFVWSLIAASGLTVLLAIKFIFFDRVMSVPGLPRLFLAPGKPLHSQTSQ